MRALSKTPLDSLTGRTYAIVDVETNGMSATHGQIIEIGIVRIEEGRITDTYETLVKPDRGLPPVISALTGISDADMHRAPRFEEVAPRIQDLLTDAVFVAHNARFDYSFVKSEFRRLGISWNAKTLCTVKVSRRLYPEHARHNLDALIDRHGIPMNARHRAFDDAYALFDFFRIAEKDHAPAAIKDAITYALGSRTLPVLLDPNLVRDLPHAPGVYIFYGSEDEVLYVGKSTDIKARVLSHFSGDHITGKERALCEQVAYIEHEETSGELSALLRESALIKELLPIYNRRLRKAKKLAVILKNTNKHGYHAAEIAYRDELDTSDLGTVYGVFRTLSQGKTALKAAVREYGLCPKLLGTEHGTGPCFAYQLGKCAGACLGKEDTTLHNQRFEEAFESRRLRAWPFRGPVVLPEDPEAEEGVAYVIDQWKVRKIIQYTLDGYAEDEDTDLPFDYDSYKILAAHLLRPDVRKKLVPYT